ncbi:armadillo-type protein [Gymnopilus junonius]|uniref:Nucleolar protein 9 n=1 Tax=Gymnopilus junonius TaxID=109634 RepID=A0A9P5NAD3_GYMJU|nr:armadillo-type protein [Gymnopilus junonius]
MPRENRKRGKKHKKQREDEPQYEAESEQQIEAPEEPSWIVPASNHAEEVNQEAPFGYVDVDLKAYFRTVDVQIQEWQENQEDTVEDGDVDPNEQRRLFFIAALTEIRGKEKQLATDPDCSVILERMSYSMDDFVRRVFLDTLAGSYEVLLRHRFASHVCQTLFTVARDTISRESKGVITQPSTSQEEGELRTMTRLILDICEEILPSLSSLILDPFASHVVRSLLLLLSPNLSASEENTRSAVRSKKSAAWKAKQGQMKSVFADEKGKGKEISRNAPPEFSKMARRLVQIVRNELDGNETRAMAASKVACPGLQMLLEVEADQDMSNEPGSLMDRVTVGLITACRDDPSANVEESDYLGTLLRDPHSSHLLEIIVSRCSDNVFRSLWKTYLKGKLARLGAHPVANFVLAKALERVSENELSEAYQELDGVWSKLIRTSRTGVLRAVIDRAAALESSAEPLSQVLNTAFDIVADDDKKLLVPCVLTLLPLPDYRTALLSKKPDGGASHHNGQQSRSSQGPLEPKIQGSLLIQSLLRLPSPHNQFALDATFSLPVEERIKIAHTPSGSRVFDVLLDSTTVPAKAKRQLVMGFIGHYHLLIDDKLGSRVGDRCWAFADTYLKEKIARSLIQQEHALAASFYGKFFARNLNLYLLQRRPEEWRSMQSNRKRAQESQPTHIDPSSKPQVAATEHPGVAVNRKRKSRPDNEIDALFDEKLGKRVKKATLADIQSTHTDIATNLKDSKTGDKELDQVLGAIRLAPANDTVGRKRRGIKP